MLTETKTTGHIQRVPRPSAKEQIIEAALVTFHERGFSGASIQDIAVAAKSPKGSIYNHFTRKEELGIAALELYAAKAAAQYQTILTCPGQTGGQRMEAYFAFLGELVERSGFEKGCLIGNLSSEVAGIDEDFRTALARCLEKWSDDLAQVIEEGIHDGSFRNDVNPKRSALFLLAAWQGALSQAKALTSKSPFDDFMTYAFRPLLAEPTAPLPINP